MYIIPTNTMSKDRAHVGPIQSSTEGDYYRPDVVIHCMTIPMMNIFKWFGKRKVAAETRAGRVTTSAM